MENIKRNRRRRRGLLAILMACAALVSATGATLSLALFTDQAVVAGNFTTGTIHIGVTPTPTIFNATAMMPGDTITQAVDVQNTGTAQMRYAVSGTATNADGKNLAGSITIEIRTVGTGCSNTVFDGTSLWSGFVPTTSTATLIGTDYTAHPNGGRTVNAGLFDHLCFRASLPKTVTDVNLEGATTSMTFTFYAEQTANNP